MICSSRLCGDSCNLMSRKKAARQKPIVKKDFNNWLSEYQRNFNRSPEPEASPVVGWAPYYNAQLQTHAYNALGEPAAWSVGGGDGSSYGGKDKQPSSSSAASCSGRPGSCAQGQGNGSQQKHIQTNNKTNQRGAAFYDKQRQEELHQTKKSRQRQQAIRPKNLPEFKEGCPGKILFKAGDQCQTNQPRPCCQFSTVKRTRIRKKDVQSKTDSGLNRQSTAMRLWQNNNGAHPPAFSCLPWQVQRAQIALEERGHVSHYYSQCAYY